MKIITSKKSQIIDILEDGGKAKGKKEEDYNKTQLDNGKNIEKEHIEGNPNLSKKEKDEIAAKISKDHLEESKDKKGEKGGKYYDKLEKNEKQIEKEIGKKASSDQTAHDDLQRLVNELPQTEEDFQQCFSKDYINYINLSLLSNIMQRAKNNPQLLRLTRGIRQSLNQSYRIEKNFRLYESSILQPLKRILFILSERGRNVNMGTMSSIKNKASKIKHSITDEAIEKILTAKKESETKEGWPKKLKKGRFTEWCKRNGFDGPSKACADKAMDSDDSSVRGMASFYVNTTLKKKKSSTWVNLLK